MRKYRIKEVELGFILKKVFMNDDGVITIVLYWNGKYRDEKKMNAKTYYFEDEALSHLMVAKKVGNEK